jgi:endonuclease YncB( thermonuclease family)
VSTRTYPLFANHPSPFPTDGRYRGICSHVVDGDTYDVLIDLGFGAADYQTLRLHAIDTPEIFHPKSAAELALGQKARDICIALLQDRPVLLRTYRDDQTFGRYVADVWSWNSYTKLWEDLAARMTREKLLKSDVMP